MPTIAEAGIRREAVARMIPCREYNPNDERNDCWIDPISKLVVNVPPDVMEEWKLELTPADFVDLEIQAQVDRAVAETIRRMPPGQLQKIVEQANKSFTPLGEDAESVEFAPVTAPKPEKAEAETEEPEIVPTHWMLEEMPDGTTQKDPVVEKPGPHGGVRYWSIAGGKLGKMVSTQDKRVVPWYPVP